MMGGKDEASGVYFNDVWTIGSGENTMTLVKENAEWTPRHKHCVVRALNSDTIYVIGGVSADGDKQDTWRSTDYGITFTMIESSSAVGGLVKCISTAENEVFLIDAEGTRMTIEIPTDPTQPLIWTNVAGMCTGDQPDLQRPGFSLTFMPKNRKIVLGGGTSGGSSTPLARWYVSDVGENCDETCAAQTSSETLSCQVDRMKAVRDMNNPIMAIEAEGKVAGTCSAGNWPSSYTNRAVAPDFQPAVDGCHPGGFYSTCVAKVDWAQRLCCCSAAGENPETMCPLSASNCDEAEHWNSASKRCISTPSTVTYNDMWSSDDGGACFTKVSNGVNSNGFANSALVVLPRENGDEGLLLAVGLTSDPASEHRQYYSMDFGTTWNVVNDLSIVGSNGRRPLDSSDSAPSVVVDTIFERVILGGGTEFFSASLAPTPFHCNAYCAVRHETHMHTHTHTIASHLHLTLSLAFFTTFSPRTPTPVRNTPPSQQSGVERCERHGDVRTPHT